MRVIYHEETDARIREYVQDYDASGIFVDTLLQYGSLPLSERMQGGDLQLTKSGIGWHLKTNVWGYLPGGPKAFQNAPLTLTADFGGDLVRLLDAPVTMPTPMKDHSTDILAGTPGVLLDKLPLRNPVPYIGRTPKYVIRDALHRVPYYDRGSIEIPEFLTPLIDRRSENGEAFADDAFPKNILDAVAEVTGCVYNDRATNYGHRVSPDIATGEGEPIRWIYDEDDDRQVVDFQEPAPAAPDEQFTSVVVRDRFENGSIRIWEEAPIDYSNYRYPPPAGRIMFVDFNGTDELDTLTANEAYRRAFAEARALTKMLHFGQIEVLFNPFLEPVDVIQLENTREDPDGLFRCSWRAVIEDVMHHQLASGTEMIKTQLNYRAVLVDEIRLPDPPIRLPGVTAQVVDYASLEVA
jgi:hypothetical protein